MVINESEAFQVFQGFNTLPPADQPRAAKMLADYRQQQERLGAPLWPSQEDAKRRQYERAREIIFDPLKLDSENGAYVQADRVAPGTGDKMRQRDAAIAWTATKYQVPEQDVRDKWPAYKADLGSKWGTGVLDDTAFFSRAKQEQQKEDARVDLYKSAQDAAFQSAIAGGDDLADFGNWQATQDNEEAWQDATHQIWSKTRREIVEAIGPNRELIAKAPEAMRRLQTGAATDADRETLDRLAWTVTDATGKQRQVMLRALAHGVRKVAEEQGRQGIAGTATIGVERMIENGFGGARFGESTAAKLDPTQPLRVGPITNLDDATRALDKLAKAEFAERVPFDPNAPQLPEARQLSPEEQALMQQAKERVANLFKTERELKQLAIQSTPLAPTYGELRAEGAGFFEALARGGAGSMVAGTTQSLALIAPALLGPGGAVLVGGGYANMEYEQLLTEYPDMSAEDAARVAVLSGGIQAALDKATLFGLDKFSPNLRKLLTGNATRELVKQAVGKTAGLVTFENFIEGLQDVTTPAVQAVLSDLENTIPTVDWQREYREFANSRADVFIGMLPLMLIGAGVNTARNREQAKALLSDNDALARAGYIESDRIAAIEKAQAGDVEGAAAVLEEGFDRRSPELAAEMGNEQGAKAINDWQTVRQAAEAGVIPRIRRDGNGWTVEQNGAFVKVGSRDEALQIALSSVDENARTEAEALAKVAEAYSSGQDVVDLQLGTVRRLQDEGLSEQQVRDLAIAEGMVNGMTREEAEQATWYVMGKNQLETKEGVRRAVVSLYRGASVLDAVEEPVEARLKLAWESGALTREQTLDWIRTAAEIMGAPELVTAAESGNNGMIEAVSDIVLADVFGQRRDGRKGVAGAVTAGIKAKLRQNVTSKTASQFGQFLAAFRAFFAQVFRRSRALAKARKEGRIGEDFDAFLDTVMGTPAQQRFEAETVKEGFAMLQDMMPDTPALEGQPYNINEEIVDVTASKKLNFIKEGKPVALYHGSQKTELKTISANSSWTTSIKLAQKYAGPNGRVYITQAVVPQNNPAYQSALNWDQSPESFFDRPNEIRLGEIQVATSNFSLSRVTPQQDAEYLAAIQAGDIETAQRLADEAAKKTGAVEDALFLFHGGNKAKKSFEAGPSRAGIPNAAAYLTDTKRVAWKYALGGGIADGLSLADYRRKQLEQLPDRQPTVQKLFLFGKVADFSGWKDRITSDKLLEVFGEERLRNTLEEFSSDARQMLEDGESVESALEFALKEGAWLQEDTAATKNEPELQFVAASGLLDEYLRFYQKDIIAYDDAEAGGKTYVALNPSQIKSADPVTYDDNGNVIPLSQRFQSESPDIRFSLSRNPVDVADTFLAQRMRSPEFREIYFNAARDRLARLRKTKSWQAAQEPDASRKERQLAALKTLDTLLMAFPPEVRGKVGGFVKLASFETDAARSREIERRLEKLDVVVEEAAKKHYEELRDKLFTRAKPKKKAGEKPKGKAGADVHDLFATLEDALGWTAEKAESYAAGLEAEAASGDLTPEQEAHNILEAQLVRMFADWFSRSQDGKRVHSGADSARMEAAVKAATAVFEKGYAAAKIEAIKIRERRAAERSSLIADTGKTGSKAERREKQLKDAGMGGWFSEKRAELMSFEGVLQAAFGENSEVARKFADWQRKADNQKEDAIQRKAEEVEAFFTKLAGGRRKGERLRWDLAQPTIDIDGTKWSQMELITATLMWRQADGRRHMEGFMDENGKPAGPWHYGEEWVAKAEGALSPKAVALREYLAGQYEAGWKPLNDVYSKLYGINLPQIPNYAPITVQPMQVKESPGMDPVTGNAQAVGSTPGGLKTRGTAIAEPDFKDALQVFIAHTKQMEHWKAYAEFVQEARAVFGNREVNNAVKSKDGDQSARTLQGWLNYFADGGARDAAAQLALSQTLSRMTNRAAAATLVGRIGTILVQVTQLGAAASNMPTGAYVRGLSRLFTGRLGWADAINSPYIQRRIKQMPPVLQQAMQGLGTAAPSAITDAARQVGQLMSGADGLFTAGTYAITYDYQLTQAKALGLTGKAAEDYARNETERIVDRLAQPTRAGARSLLEVTTTNPIMRLVWSFASESRKNLGLLIAASQSGMTSARFGRAALFVFLLNSGLAWLVRTAWRDLREDEDDDELWSPASLGLAMSTEWMTGIPVLGSLLQAGAYQVAGEWKPEGNLFSSTIRGVKAAERLPEMLSGELTTKETLRDVEMILQGMAIADDRLAALASFSHLLRDVTSLADNAQIIDTD